MHPAINKAAVLQTNITFAVLKEIKLSTLAVFYTINLTIYIYIYKYYLQVLNNYS